MQALGWGFPAERFAWLAVELGGDGVEVLAGAAIVGRLTFGGGDYVQAAV
ncbi:hypothetical protein OOK58_01770 [Streptomyces sp. NBC_01728]|nr:MULTISPECIES: hypothetical protein [unclassified Streptomyces]MCX4461425.1 hypothetical protein [Streptomyces sp. NBC_01719]MCX4490333.1 hypothetical protein [Streptomyces sp. NBC_01728]MCX4597130.1 hypothetical protein [Streptomyces sp. NBC_01549]